MFNFIFKKLPVVSKIMISWVQLYQIEHWIQKGAIWNCIFMKTEIFANYHIRPDFINGYGILKIHSKFLDNIGKLRTDFLKCIHWTINV